MDFKKCSEVYGYKSIAEVEEEEMAEKIAQRDRDWIDAMFANGKLTDEEFSLIKKHVATGARILEKIEEMPELAEGAHWHHERVDGRGYPYGLKGDQIPVEARIIAVADAYDAMTSNRSYRDAMPQSQVREEIEHGLGTQFDPEYGKIMLEMIDEDKDYQMREM